MQHGRDCDVIIVQQDVKPTDEGGHKKNEERVGLQLVPSPGRLPPFLPPVRSVCHVNYPGRYIKETARDSRERRGSAEPGTAEARTHLLQITRRLSGCHNDLLSGPMSICHQLSLTAYVYPTCANSHNMYVWRLLRDMYIAMHTAKWNLSFL